MEENQHNVDFEVRFKWSAIWYEFVRNCQVLRCGGDARKTLEFEKSSEVI
jgi:hypothetical protein